MGCVIDAVGGKVLEYAIEPILRQLGYLCFYNTNIKELEKQLENLETKRETVQNLVDLARSNADEIEDDVSKWLAKVNDELANIRQQHGNPSCFNLFKRHQLSRKSTKRVKDIVELIMEGNFDNVGHPAPLPITSTLPEDYQILESRTAMAEKIKDALADPNVNKVGVCGMGGVGKTKLLDEVKKIVLENKLFDRVINVTIGQSYFVTDIQDQIGGQLNMELERKAKTKEARANFLQIKLDEMKDNILIMLDDLWKEYDLEKDVGIPCRSESRKKGCKIILTSRSRDLLTNKMNTEKCFQVNFLSEEESWKFFMAIVGEFDKICIQHIAKDVVEQCGGLPLALEIIAKALKGKEVCIWKDALKQLKNPISVNIEGVSDQVYSSLELSYNSIKDEARLLFLLCSVFPDDHDIYMKDLQMYAMSMGLLKDIDNWEDARNRVIKLVDDLKSSALLLESNSWKNCVKMHDVVRDVAKFIASNEDKRLSTLSYGYGQSEWREKERCGSYNAIFIDCKDFPNLPPNLKFPNLQLLILKHPRWPLEKATQIPDAFFEGMEKLRVLDMTKMHFEPSSWTSLTHSLKNLQTLCMSYCECNDIDTIGQLKRLEILMIDECMIHELPATMSQLTQLKVLHVSNCSNLKVIPPNIISSMIKLEELNLWRSVRRWGEEVSYKNELIKNVRLSELNGLTSLSNLRLGIPNVDLILDDLSSESAKKLEEFHICVGDDDNWLWHESFGEKLTRRLTVNNIKWQNVSIGGALQILLEGCEKLRVRGSVGFTEDLFHSHIDRNSDMPRRNNVQVTFPELKDLTIEGGNNLEMLWYNNGLTTNSFEKLQNICISCCNKLKYIFPSNMVASLIFLNRLEIDHCPFLERIFEIECLIDDARVVPLTKLILRGLPNLECVWNKDPGEFLTFPNLKEVDVSGCPQLKSLLPTSFIKHVKAIESLRADGINEIFLDQDEALKLEPCDQIIFSGLISLKIAWKAMKGSFKLRSNLFPKLENLVLIGSEDDDTVSLPLEISQVLHNIEQFTIRDAFQLVHVFSNEKENNHVQRRRLNLKKLELDNLPNLTHVWKDNTGMTTNFDCLEYIEVRKCEKLKWLVPSSMNFFNLVNLKVWDCNGMQNLFSSSVAKNLASLERMNISSCRGMSSIVEAEGEENGEEIVFKKLTELTLNNLPRLGSFYSGKCSLKFPCLEKLSIERCPEMKTFPYGIGSMPELEYMKTSSRGKAEGPAQPACSKDAMMKDMGEDETQSRIKIFFTQQVSFHELKDLTIQGIKNLEMLWQNNGLIKNSLCKLQSIQIEDCKSLRCLFPSNMVISLVFLNSLTIFNCDLLETIFEIEKLPGKQKNDEKTVPLKYLSLISLPNLKHVWNKDPEEFLTFPNLKDINISGCDQLKSLFPPSFVKHLQEIESLTLAAEMFLEDAMSKLVFPKIVFPSLRKLEMEYKTLKRSFWLRSESCPKLRSLKLNGISSSEEENLVTLPFEMSKALYIIEEFNVQNVFQLVHVFQNEEYNNHIQRRANLKKLELCNLPNLTHVWKDDTGMTTSFDYLEYIKVRKCEKLRWLVPSSMNFFNLVNLKVCNCNGMQNLFSSSVAKNLVSLGRMDISSCRGMSSIVAAEGGEGEEENGQEIVFNKLTKLKLNDLPKLNSFYSGKCSLKFPSLEKLSIKECPELKTFPYTMKSQRRTATGEGEFSEDEIVFSGLIILEIAWKLVQRSFKLRSNLFPKLVNLVLIGSEDNDTVSLPLEISQVLHNIEEFTIRDAFQLVHVFSNEEENNHVQRRRLNLKKLALDNLPNLTHVWKDNTGMTTSFDCLEDVRVRDCEKVECLLPSSITFFNLKTLRIFKCKGMLNLFSSSVATNLTNLSIVEIWECEGMTSIVGGEGEGAEENNGEEIVFKKLSKLILYNLPRLGSFYSGKCSLKFPCLEELIIERCPQMKTFSNGIVSMPELHYITTKEDEIRVLPIEDINVIIQDLWKDDIVRSIKNLFTQQVIS